ncbi:MAG: MurR/RpiR family transcriptional regulator [Clostridia bacterium]|nr:MurR/RpiR family transcriptional regulator [Clostridia bacterium]
MQNSCIMSIKNKYELLTAAEKKIADYILNNRETVLKMTVAELAKSASVANSAIIRCCNSLGFKSYSEMKISLASEVSQNKQLNYVPYIYPDENASEILDKIFAADIKTLHDTASGINRKTLEKAVDKLLGANTIYIYGVGTSSGAVNDFQYRLMQLGYSAFCYTDVAAMKVSTMNIKAGDIAVGISHSGRTVATIEALKLAKIQGADTICITSYPDSLITKESDFVLEIFSDEIQYPVEAVSARIAHLAMIDVITVSMSAKNYKETEKRSKETRNLLNTIRYKERKK